GSSIASAALPSRRLHRFHLASCFPPYSAMRPHPSHINAITAPAVGCLPVQKLRRSSGRRYSSDVVYLCTVGPGLVLSMTMIGDIRPWHSTHVRDSLSFM